MKSANISQTSSREGQSFSHSNSTILIYIMKLFEA